LFFSPLFKFVGTDLRKKFIGNETQRFLYFLRESQKRGEKMEAIIGAPMAE
jgi:hypothetical protein